MIQSSNVHKFKWQMYCANCLDIVGYTDHEFQLGEILVAKHIFDPQGVPTIVGDAIKHSCTILRVRMRNNATRLARGYKEMFELKQKAGLHYMPVLHETNYFIDKLKSWFGFRW